MLRGTGRRTLRILPIGGTPNPASGYRFSTQYGVLEYKMNNLSPSEEIIVRTTYIVNLITLEAAIFGTGANLDTAQAAVWTHNKNEQRDRDNLFNSSRRRFCGFLGISPGPDLGCGGISVVV